MSKKRPIGIVYSTDPNYQYVFDEQEEQTTLPPNQQKLHVQVEKHHHAGKVVTVVTGFIGTTDDINALGKMLKTRCGVGGSVKDGEIWVQGDHHDKIVTLLTAEGYRVK